MLQYAVKYSLVLTVLTIILHLLPCSVYAFNQNQQSAIDSVEKWIYEDDILENYLENTNDIVLSQPIECYVQTNAPCQSTLPYYLGYGLSAVGMAKTNDLLFTVHQYDYPRAVLHLRWKTDHWALEAIDGPDAQILITIDYLTTYLREHSLENEPVAVVMTKPAVPTQEFDLMFSGVARWYAFTPRYNGYMADNRLGGIYRTRDAVISYYKTIGAEWIPKDYTYTFYLGTQYVSHYSIAWIWCINIGIPVLLISSGFLFTKRKKKNK